jgi:predicted unusual protein kinase regulating ubiquinone biosynthesis (AarF/ABC1/UbiB family)
MLVMERLDGVSVGDALVLGAGLSQADRDEIAWRILELCLSWAIVRSE